jgi:cytochrome c oxidase subunit 1
MLRQQKISAGQPATDQVDYLHHRHDLRSWFLTDDHKRVALMYLGAIIVFLMLGGLAASVLRLELTTPAADLLPNTLYRRVFTAHGLLMIFFGLAPGIPAVLGNFVIPLMIGAKNVAFPRLNLWSWYLYLAAGAGVLLAILQGGLDTGWTLNRAYSSGEATAALFFTNAGLIFLGLSSILLAINFLTTIHKMRAPGLTWLRLPLFVWSVYVASGIVLVTTPILMAAIFLATLEAWLQLGFFLPGLGGEPSLFQHLFWFYGNQVAYIIILPVMGVVLEIFSTFTRRRIFGYPFVVAAFLAIAGLGFVTWAVHMVSEGLSGVLALLSSFLSLLQIVPFTIIIASLAMTLYKAKIRFESPLWFALTVLGLVLVGGVTGIILAAFALIEYLHNTYFVTAHVHYAMAAALIAALGGLHFWWPKITGRAYAEGLAKIAASILFVGVNLAVFTQFILGFLGMPRHAQSYPEEFFLLQAASSLGTTILLVGYALPLVYLGWSLFSDRRVANPWQAGGLVWEETLSPPLPENFVRTPVVAGEAWAGSAPDDEFRPAPRPGITPSLPR